MITKFKLLVEVQPFLIPAEVEKIILPVSELYNRRTLLIPQRGNLRNYSSKKEEKLYSAGRSRIILE